MQLKILIIVAAVVFTCVTNVTGQSCCPPLWTKFEGNCYRHFGPKKTWSGAEAHCVSVGGHLTSIHGETENDFLYNYWRTSVPVPNLGIWTGFNDIDFEGSFRWTDGSTVDYIKWQTGQPDNGAGIQDCGRIWYADAQSDVVRSWDDGTCSVLSSYVCKKAVCHCTDN